MANSGSALMGIGKSIGEDRAVEAAKMAINSPLLEVSIDGARGVLFNVSGGADMAMAEINEAARIITEHIDPDAKVIFGAVLDDKLKKGELKVTVVATGFNNGYPSATKPPMNASINGRSTMQNMFENEPRRPSSQINGTPAVKELVDSSVNDEEFDIPAFIRRKMNK